MLEESLNDKLINSQFERDIISTTDSIRSLEYEDDIDNVDEDIKSSCLLNFFYYISCCCCCGCCQCCFKKNKNNNFYIKKWRTYLDSQIINTKKDDVFTPLTKFFAKSEDAIDELKKVRLNPDLLNLDKNRNDLEFYIPQLCSFILFNELKYIEEFFAFLCKAAYINFFFAQRVHWFLSAMIDIEEEKKDKIISILQMINTLFESENNRDQNNLINFYISMSDSYLNYIQENDLTFLYLKQINNPKKNVFDIIEKDILNSHQLKIFNKYKTSREKINYFSSRELENAINKYRNPKYKEEKFHPDKFEADDFFIDISIFELKNEDLTYESSESFYGNNLEYEVIENKRKSDLNFVSYHSSINFIEHLCDISNELANQPIDNQKIFLYKKLTEINKKLPFNVYLPFLHDSCRNYLICHIPLEAASIFKTKTRCPIMLTFELIRISDISAKIYGKKKNNIQEEDKILSNPIYSTENSDNVLKIRSKNDINDFINQNGNIKKNEYDENKIREIIKNHLNIKYKKNNEKLMNTFMTQNRNLELSLYNKKSNNDNSIEINEIIQNERNNRLTTFEKTDSNDEENTEQNQNETLKEITVNIEVIKNVFGNTFKENEKKIKQESLFGNIPSHKIFRCIIKTNEDLRQEQFATQLINEFSQIFKLEKVNCYLNTYEIISTGNNSGLVEMVNDSISIDQLKQKTSNLPLNDFFIHFFDKKTKPDKYKKAMNNYIKSLAGYSLLCYFLQIKDRHNGNILLDRNGHIIHIDFGFLLSNAPGKGLKFETAPFKLTKDMIDVLGGENSEYFIKFKQSIRNGFKAIIKNKEKILILVEMMWCGNGKNLPCFEREQETINELRNRLEPKNENIVEELISQSIKSWTTTVYDYFQYYVQGINC